MGNYSGERTLRAPRERVSKEASAVARVIRSVQRSGEGSLGLLLVAVSITSGEARLGGQPLLRPNSGDFSGPGDTTHLETLALTFTLPMCLSFGFARTSIHHP